MSKILLVYDDFAELNATELSLKKSGFDVIGLTNEYTIKDQIVSFNPDILVGFGNSQRVGSLSVGKKLKDMNRWTGKSVLIFPKSYELPAEELLRMRMDMLLESPISVIRLIQIICKLLKLDEKAVIEKLAKSFAKDRHDDLAFASYDSDTVKVIQHIQGELENFNAEKPQALPEESAPAIGKVDQEENTGDVAVEPERPIKKSFFEEEKSESPVVEAKSDDPFAALINELKGEAKSNPKTEVKLEPKVEVKPQTAKPAVILPDDEVLDFNVVGRQIKDEVAQAASELSEKVKKYTQMTAELHLYPESTIKKVKAKKQLNNLKKGWSADELEEQDKARREFVAALMKSSKTEN
tara:strand:- start:40504 stop:41562 length:1059 start_codon:yes stop_codon:yes gene_type:complete